MGGGTAGLWVGVFVAGIKLSLDGCRYLVYLIELVGVGCGVGSGMRLLFGVTRCRVLKVDGCW